MRTTHTYAILKVSKEAYEEIRLKLELAGYDFQFHSNDEEPGSPIIDMHGIAIAPEVEGGIKMKEESLDFHPFENPGRQQCPYRDNLPPGFSWEESCYLQVKDKALDENDKCLGCRSHFIKVSK